MHTKSCGWYVTPLLAVASLGAGAQDTRLVDAAKAADATSVGRLLEQGVDANIPQSDGATALHWAVHWDDVEMADALVRAGAAVNVTNDFGVTPLWLACLNANATMIESLLTAGANANAALPSGETALMTASRTGSEAAVKLLLTHGANVNAQEHSRGQTALMWAVAQQHPEVVKTLIELGANVHARSDTRPRRIHTRTAGFNPTGVIDITQGGYTAMLFAAREGTVDVARHLVAAQHSPRSYWNRVRTRTRWRPDTRPYTPQPSGATRSWRRRSWPRARIQTRP